MKSRKASGRYAQSLIQLAIEKSQLEEVRADMELVAKTCSASDDLTQMLQSSIIKTEVKQRALEAVFSKKVSDLSMHFMNMLAEKKREAILEAAADSFISIYNEKEGIVEATVTSATNSFNGSEKTTSKLFVELWKNHITQRNRRPIDSRWSSNQNR